MLKVDGSIPRITGEEANDTITKKWQIYKSPHLSIFENGWWCLNFIFSCSISQYGFSLRHSSLSDQPPRRLWDEPAQLI